jgi:hypothetical protein
MFISSLFFTHKLLTHTLVHIYIYAHELAHKHTQTRTDTRVHTHIHTHTHTHKCTHARAHTHNKKCLQVHKVPPNEMQDDRRVSFTVSLKGAILAVEPERSLLFGWPLDDFKGKHVSDVSDTCGLSVCGVSRCMKLAHTHA